MASASPGPRSRQDPRCLVVLERASTAGSGCRSAGDLDTLTGSWLDYPRGESSGRWRYAATSHQIDSAEFLGDRPNSPWLRPRTGADPSFNGTLSIASLDVLPSPTRT